MNGGKQGARSKAFDARMEKDGYWLGGSGYGYGYPVGGYWFGGMAGNNGMAMGAASAIMGYANARPGYEVRVLLSAADILARYGMQLSCEDALDRIQASSDQYKTGMQGRDLRVANALGFRKQELSLAQPVVGRAAAFRSDDLLGSEVRPPGNVALGSVDHIVMGAESGGIAYLVVAHGGVFGLGEHHVAVPWDRFKVSPHPFARGLLLNKSEQITCALERALLRNYKSRATRPGWRRSARSPG